MRQLASEYKRIHLVRWGIIGLLALSVLVPTPMSAQAGEQGQEEVAVTPEATASPAPAPPKGTTTWYRVGGDKDSYVVKLGSGTQATIGSKACRSGAGQAYVIRDDATIRQIDAFFKAEGGQQLTQQTERQFRAVLDKAIAGGLAVPSTASSAKSTATWHRVTADSYVVNLASGTQAVIGSQACRSGAGQEYVIRDEATIQQLDALFKAEGGQQLTQQTERQFRAVLDKAIASGLAVPPTAPSAKGAATWHRVTADSYVVKLGGGGPATLGSQACSSGAGKQFTVRDEATIRQIEALFKAGGGQQLSEQSERQLRALLDKAIAGGLAQEIK